MPHIATGSRTNGWTSQSEPATSSPRVASQPNDPSVPTSPTKRFSDTLPNPARDTDDVTYPYTEILVPTDGSEGAEAAIGSAVDIASTYDARIHALSVIDTMAMGVDVRSSALLDSLEASVSAVETAIEQANPYPGIRSYVEDHDIGLVVMGTHGRSGIEKYLLGSVAEKTVRTSPVPVLTVRKPE